jgi:hypothetical protein
MDAFRVGRAHSGEVFLALLTIGIAQFFDFGTFVVMMRIHGPAAELNPLVASGFGSIGIVGLAFAKSALVLLVVSGVVLLRQGRWGERRRLAGFLTGLAILAGLIGGTSNAIAI